METGVLGLDGFPGTETGLGSLASTDSEATRQKWCSANRSGVLNKQEGSEFSIDDWRASKVAKTSGDFSNAPTAATSAAMLLQGRSILMSSSSAGTSSASTAAATTNGDPISSDSHFQQQEQQQNMLSFSCCSKLEAATLSYLPQMVAAHSKNAGYHTSALTAASNVYLLSGIRGPFTQSQWLELEQQALIYKYITANEPIPSHLLIPIRKALESAGLYGFNCAHLKPTAWGWGPFHLGYSNSSDPEPGRCRRTDGKKWRCSRDAVPDQKYCERHMNRGRHRSRKLVEGQATGNGNSNGHSVPGTKMSSSAVKLASSSAVLGPEGSSSNSFDLVKNFQPASNPLINRMLGNRVDSGHGMQDSTTQLSFLPPSINLNSSDHSLSVSKAQHPCEESTPGGFGVPSSGSIFSTSTTTLHKNALSGNYCSSSSYDFNHQVDPEAHHSLHGVVDEWPTTHAPDRSSILWPDSQSKTENTELSMSIPMGPADFMSSTSSPNDKATLSPLRLSRELDKTQMNLGVGLEMNDQSQGHSWSYERQTNWIPISWGASMGGPLGEVLQSTSGNTNSSIAECKKISSSPLNLLSKGWDGGLQSSSSPTGVLQRSAFVSLSNSSAGSSPRADNSKAIESGGLCNGLMGTTLCHSSSLPSFD